MDANVTVTCFSVFSLDSIIQTGDSASKRGPKGHAASGSPSKATADVTKSPLKTRTSRIDLSSSKATPLSPAKGKETPGFPDPLASFVEAVTDRVIDKLCHMELSSSNSRSPSAAAALQPSTSAALDKHIPVIDLKEKSVVVITLTARRPGANSKLQTFKGTVHLNTNDVRLSEDVDDLLEAAKKTRRATGGSHAHKQATAAAAAAGESDAVLSVSDSNSDPEAGTKKNGENGGSSQSSGSPTDAGPEGDQVLQSSGSPGQHEAVRQRDPRGRKVGSTVSCKKLSSLEARLTDRVHKLRHVIESNGYDFGQSQLTDQTEIARVAHGVEQIAFQRLLVYCRDKTALDLEYSHERGLTQVAEEHSSSPLTPF